MRHFILTTSTGKVDKLSVEASNNGFEVYVNKVRELCLEDPAVEWVTVVEGENHTKIFRGFALSGDVLGTGE